MTTDYSKPVNTTAYSDVYQYLRDNIIDVSTWFDVITGLNIPTNAKRFNTTNRRFEYWNGSAWVELLAKATVAYDIRAAVATLADTATTATTAGACATSAFATLAGNATNLDGDPASTYTQNTDIRPVLYGGTFASTASGARTNLSLYSITECNTNFAARASNLSDLANVATARSNLSVLSTAEGDAKYLLETNNLSDLTNFTTARSSLSVYSQAQINTRFTFIYSTTDTSVGVSTTVNIIAPTEYFFSYMSSSGLGVTVNSLSADGKTLNVTGNALGTSSVKVFWMKQGV